VRHWPRAERISGQTARFHGVSKEKARSGSAACAGIFHSFQRLLRIATQPATQHPHHIDIQDIFAPKASLRDGFTASFVISSVSRAFLPPSQATIRQHRRLLDISVGISGPHDFAVRSGCVRLSHHKRPPHPAPNVRDDRETPLLKGHGIANRSIPVSTWASSGFLKIRNRPAIARTPRAL
jgi:hypothetical protein